MTDLTAWTTTSAVVAERPHLTSSDNDAVTALIPQFEALAERYLGTAYIPRTGTYTGTPYNGILELPHVNIRSITSVVNLAGAAVTYDTLWKARGALAVSSHEQVVCTYRHGFDAPTARLVSACNRWIERMIVVERTATSRDTLSQSFEGGTTRYSTPDWNAGRPTGFLQIDADLNSERDHRPRIF